MSINEIQTKINEIRELNRMMDELQTELETIKDSIKAHMTEQGVDELLGTDYKVTWKEVTTTRIDGKALAKDFPEMASKYTKTTTSRRFNVA